MHWITIVIFGHLLNALSFILNKVLLTKDIKNAFAFTFWIGVLSMAVVVAMPFGFEVPTVHLIIVNLVAGVTFSSALLFFFFALKGADTSRVVPFIGGGIPVFTLVFELLFLDGHFTGGQLLGFAVLAVGTVLIAVEEKKKGAKKNSAAIWVCAVLAALSFAISFGMSKIAFNEQPFLSAFIWSRFGAFGLPAK